MDRDELLKSLENGIQTPKSTLNSQSQKEIADLLTLLDVDDKNQKNSKGMTPSEASAARKARAASLTAPSNQIKKRPSVLNSDNSGVSGSLGRPRSQTLEEEESNEPIVAAGLMTGRPEDEYPNEEENHAIEFTSGKQFMTIKRKTKKGTTFQVDHYQLGERLGRGAFGIVYKGLDMNTGQFVAVKRMTRTAGADLDQINSEIKLLSRLSHPNIVKYIEVIMSTNHINLVLEFVDSGSLANVLAGYGFFPEPLAALYTEQVLKGLQYLHENEIIHRDIKGANLLITKEGVIKLADFGIAHNVRDCNQRHSLVEGSAYWMSPEVIELEVPTTSSDIWSLGCTLIELLTGVPPFFEMVALSAVYKMVKEEHPPFPEDISCDLEDFLKLCFRRNPKTRPTAKELREHIWIKSRAGTVSPASNGTMNEPLPPVVDLDSARRTVKKYATLREQNKHGKQLKKVPIASINFSGIDSDEESSTPSSASSMTPTSPTSSVASVSNASSLSSHSLDASNGSDSARKRDKKKKSSSSSSSKDKKKKDKKSRDKKSSKSKKKQSGSFEGLQVEFRGTETRRAIFAYTVYVVHVASKEDEWDIEKTWSDFKELSDKLVKLLPNATSVANCPPRKFFGQLDPKFITKRKEDLSHFLIQDIMANDAVANSADAKGVIQSFLQSAKS